MSSSMHTPRRLWHIAKSRTTAAAGLVVAGSLLLGSLPGAFAAPVTNGYREDESFGTSVRTPTAEKPESKLWYNDGTWWASMYSRDNPSGPELEPGYFVHKLNLETKDWERQDTQLDRRDSSSADTLWDQAAGKLYVASHIKDGDNQPNEIAPDDDKRFFRYSYNSISKSYVLDPEFAPNGVSIAGNSSETLVIARETSNANRLWATWVESPVTETAPVTGEPTAWGAARVMVGRSDNGGQTWTTYSLADAITGPGIAAAMGMTNDDISTIVAYNGRIGVMWSNQTDRKTYFASHVDGAANTAWTSTVVFQDSTGGKASDDHLNIKLQAAGNKLYAVTKTNFNEDEGPDIVLLACTNGTCTSPDNWSAYTVYNSVAASVEHTRPVLLVDTTTGNEKVHIFSAQPTSTTAGPQAIYRKSISITAPLTQDIVNAAPSVPFISSATDPEVNDPTTTKQSVNVSTGMVVLASDDSTNHYLWNYDSLDNTPADTTPPPAPTASPAGGTYTTTQTVTLSNTEAGVTIYYTTDGSDPTTSATRQQYSAPITVSTSTTLKFYAEDAATNKSSVVTEVYTITPPAAPNAKIYLPLIINSK